MLKTFRCGIEYFTQEELYSKVKEHLKHVPYIGAYTLTYISEPEYTTYFKGFVHSKMVELEFKAEENWIDMLGKESI